MMTRHRLFFMDDDRAKDLAAENGNCMAIAGSSFFSGERSQKKKIDEGQSCGVALSISVGEGHGSRGGSHD